VQILIIYNADVGETLMQLWPIYPYSENDVFFFFFQSPLMSVRVAGLKMM